jgi:hypothetical protein
MKKLTVRIYTGGGEFIDREMNDDELAQYEIDQVDAITKKAEAEAKAAVKAALLNKLGITAEEATLLLS